MKTSTIRLDEYQPYPRNYNEHPEAQVHELGKSLDLFGQYKNVVVWREYYLAGHGLVEAARKKGLTELVAVDMSHLTQAQAEALLVADNRLPQLSQPNETLLAALLVDLPDDLTVPGVDDDFLMDLGLETLIDDQTGADTEPQVDRAEELRQQWGVEPGQLWRLGEHRLICGDCTDPAVVARVMGGERAVLCHADPPYGMGKEKDGIANDNLYRDKLDAFQMQWWGAARRYLEDNASAYIWGNAEDLWRLWYVGGLKNSERLTFRNQVIWDKTHGQGMESEQHRMYPTASEHCLFFMLGEQGFNNNADNYWEGWEPIRAYLKGELAKVGDIKWAKRTAGHSETSGCHWFDASQWTMPTEQVYKAWQAAAKGDAFKREYDDLKREYDDLKREYDDLKREFYATRAYFDNTHDNMTDVWQFGRVQGEERWGHATPKPVPMIERIVKSSALSGAIVYSPFLGSGTDLIACENLNRRCRAIELDPGYCAVALQRWSTHTHQTPELIE